MRIVELTTSLVKFVYNPGNTTHIAGDWALGETMCGLDASGMVTGPFSEISELVVCRKCMEQMGVHGRVITVEV